MIQPLVSIIVPTTPERKPFTERILNNIIKQDYVHKEILFDFDKGSVGEKRNRLCARTRGKYVIHFDDDDFYETDWVTKSVHALQESDADITGLHNFNLFDPIQDVMYEYRYFMPARNWLAGATMAYKRSFWEANPFPDVSMGEDGLFALGTSGRGSKVFNHGYTEGFLCTVHEGNTSRKQVNNGFNYRMLSEEDKLEIKKRW